MPKCARCGAETSLYINGVPICLECAEKPDRQIKVLRAEPARAPLQKP